MLSSENQRTTSWTRRLVSFALFAAVVALAVSTVVMVDETEYVLVERLGRIVAVYDRPADRGLHFKLPWPFDVARRFDRRVQLYEPAGREVFTQDKKNITVDAYLCWRIAEPNDEANDGRKDGGDAGDLSQRPVVLFYRGLGTRDTAEARLDTRVRSVLSTRIGRVELSSLLNVGDSEAGPGAGTGRLDDISRAVRDEVVQRPDEDESLAARLGLEVVDVRIRRLNFPTGNQAAVFERMRTERRKIAESYRSAGLAENKMITSQADRQYGEIIARAKADAERIRGEAEAESIGILNRAHAEDPELYRTTRTLDAYRTMLNDKTTLVLSASSNLLKLLTDGIPERPAEAPAKEPKTEPTAGAARE